MLNLIVRHSLYVDQIIVIDPFITLPHQDVQQDPRVWAQTIIDRALRLCALEDWIEQEIIILIPSIFHYHPELNQILSDLAPHLIVKRKKEIQQEFQRSIILRLLVSEPLETRDSIFDVLESMGTKFDENDKEDLLDAAAKYETRYPIRFRLPSSYYDKYFEDTDGASQVIDFSTSVPLLFAPFISNEMNAFLVFESRLLHDMVEENKYEENARTESLQQLGVAFQGLDFPFLHNVSLKKALELRNQGYLQSFRVYLRDLWTTISKIEGNEALDEKILEFSDRLKSEYSTLQQEWIRVHSLIKFDIGYNSLQ